MECNGKPHAITTGCGILLSSTTTKAAHGQQYTCPFTRVTGGVRRTRRNLVIAGTANKCQHSLLDIRSFGQWLLTNNAAVHAMADENGTADPWDCHEHWHVSASLVHVARWYKWQMA